MSIIIGIDHGYYAIKTAHCSFPAGLTSYKQAGNGVTVNVIEAIGRRIAAMDAELRGEPDSP